ncbi:carboxymuconolactone decarboxylase family protein [Chloroflexota bacterium]
MARPEDVEIAKAMKEAKTARDKVSSWTTQRPGASIEGTMDVLRLYLEKKPEMIETFAHNQLTQVIDRGILDGKTRSLVILGIYMSLRHWRGIGPQCCNAKAAGCTDEEIMEVAFLADYGVSKTTLVESGETLAAIFESPMYQGIERR